MTNFWNQLESKQITDREQITSYLTTKLGKPSTEIQHNLLQEILNKIKSYYFLEEPTNYTIYTLLGSIQEISEKKFKEGKNKGQIFYNLKLGGNPKEILQARKENLTEDKWQQITKLAILGKNLVFKYRKWITNKQVLDFYPPEQKVKIMNQTNKTNLLCKLNPKEKPTKAPREEMLAGWLTVRYHLFLKGITPSIPAKYPFPVGFPVPCIHPKNF